MKRAAKRRIVNLQVGTVAFSCCFTVEKPNVRDFFTPEREFHWPSVQEQSWDKARTDFHSIDLRSFSLFPLFFLIFHLTPWTFENCIAITRKLITSIFQVFVFCTGRFYFGENSGKWLIQFERVIEFLANLSMRLINYLLISPKNHHRVNQVSRFLPTKLPERSRSSTWKFYKLIAVHIPRSQWFLESVWTKDSFLSCIACDIVSGID